MSTATLTKKELFVQGSLTTDVAEMIEMLAVNVPGVKSCNVNAVNKSLVLSIDTTKDEGAVINELSSLIKTMDSSLKLTTSRQENKNNSKAQRKSADGDKNVSIILGGLNCAHCAEVIGQKVSDLDEVQTANLNFVNKKLNFELKNASDREVIIERVINIIDTTEPGLDIQVMESKKVKKAQDNKVEMILGGLNCAHCAEVIGQKGERGVEIDSIIRAHGLPEEFPHKVLEEADRVIVPIPEEEIKRRMDLRDLKTFTIDGEDAKDLDDAVSIEVLENGNYKLGVHIADVSHYVREHSKLDKEAIKRATSVYLVDKVIPMLPKQLSNGVCSLNPFEDKLTLSVFMEINADGKVIKYDIAESIINSKARMTYTEVSDILEKDDEKLKSTFSNLVEEFHNAEDLARILMKRRERRGSIDFDFPESKIILNSEGKVADIKSYERRISNRMIEEFMLVTNETVAEHFFWLQTPFVYRIHEIPAAEKMENLSKFIATFGYSLKGDLEQIHPKEIQRVLKLIKGTPEEESISTIMLRSMRQARYAPQCVGHFGLAAQYYCHFTSPIRRYPDLQIHRIIKEQLNGKLTEKRSAQLANIVEYASNQSSEQEREAELAERDVHDYYKAVYMADRIGQEFDGTISSVTSFGMFVELENTVEGLIRMVDMTDDYYNYIESSYSLVGERTKRVFRIGDQVRIKVSKVNVDFREIDFELVSVKEDNRLVDTVNDKVEADEKDGE